MAVNTQDLVAQIEQCEMMEKHYAARAKDLRAQLHGVTLAQPDEWNRKIKQQRRTLSSTRWTDWLRSNGPTPRKELAEIVGILTGPTPPYARALGRPMSEIPDNFYPEDMMLRISVENEHGKGRPSDVYFLWSQRYTVFPDLKVNPNVDENIETLSDVTVIEVDEPIEMVETVVPPKAKPEPVVETSEPVHYATLQEWYDGHYDSHFVYAKHGHKFDKDELRELRVDCPDGVDPNVAITYGGRGKIADLIAKIEAEKVDPIMGVVLPPVELDDGPVVMSASQRAMMEDDPDDWQLDD